MDLLWRHYGRTLHAAMVACAACYIAVTGAVVFGSGSDYGHPTAQAALWVLCSALYLAVAWRTRAPTRAPLALVPLMVAANAVTAADLDPAAVASPASWPTSLTSAVLVLIIYTGPVARSAAVLAVLVAAIAAPIALRYPEAVAATAGEVTAWLVPATVGPVLGFIPAVWIMLMLRGQADLLAGQRRRVVVGADSEPSLDQARDLLRELADGTADPLDPAVRERCRGTEQRLRAALVSDGELVVLTRQLLDGAGGGLTLVTQGGDAWDRLPREVRTGATDLISRAMPAAQGVNVTATVDAGSVWLAVTVDGGAAPAPLPPGLPKPSARGKHGEQWWLEWTVPVRRAD